MNIIAQGTILFYIKKYSLAKHALLDWHYEFCKAAYNSFTGLKNVYGNASLIANSRVIFSIKGNDFRLIVSVNFKRQAAYIIWFGTHKEYDKINAVTVSFDMNTLK